MVAPHWAAKGIPCAFNLQKAGTRKQNARNMRVFPAADYTAPAPSSPSFIEIPGETSDRIAFLLEPWAVKLSKHHHFKLAFSGSYYIASMVSRTALTVIPTSSASNSGDIDIVFSNNHGTSEGP